LIRVEHEPEVEVLPVAADLLVLDQKATGEAKGEIIMRSRLEKEALTKALGQDNPSADKPDVLVGANTFTEIKGDSIKVTITGYPAYYANFRTATEDDLYRLGIVKLEPRTIPEAAANSIAQEKPPEKDPQENVPQKPREKTTEGYFTLKYMLPVSEGITIDNFNIGGGWVWKKTGIFFGLDFGLTPASIGDDEWSIGGGLNFGKKFDLLYDFQLLGGLSAGFWYTEKYEYYYREYYDRYYGYSYSRYDALRNKVNILGAFIGARWKILEFTYRMFPDMFDLSHSEYPMEEDGWHHQFMIGVNL
jgi:hypothetical protein